MINFHVPAFCTRSDQLRKLFCHKLYFFFRKSPSSNWRTQRSSAASETTGIWWWRGRRLSYYFWEKEILYWVSIPFCVIINVFIYVYLGPVCTGVSSHMDDEYKWAGVEDPKLMVTTSRDPSSRLKMFAKVSFSAINHQVDQHAVTVGWPDVLVFLETVLVFCRPGIVPNFKSAAKTHNKMK